jgi:hypothetical protein
MAKSVTKFTLDKTIQNKVALLSISCDTSYPTGGYPLTPAECGMVQILDVSISTETVGTHFGVFDYTNNKIVVCVAAGTQVAGSADINTIKLRVRVTGY